MSTVLVVDDVKDFCEELASGLSRDGHDVSTAASGREAIQLGSTIRPDVLVTDWMLKDHIHGLDVAEVIRIVYPSVQTVLISGFASGDLRADARGAEVFDFLEKPFPLNEIRETVLHAADARRPWKHRLRIGFVEVDEAGNIDYANAGAEEMFVETAAGKYAVNIQQFFEDDQLAVLRRDAGERWVSVSPIADTKIVWTARSRPIEGTKSRAFVFLDSEHRGYKHSAIINRLLGLPDQSTDECQIEGHVLIIDDTESIRRLAVDILRYFNCMCLTARTHEEAVRLFAHDPDVKHILLDYEMPGCEAKDFVERALALRGDIKIIGTSGTDNYQAFLDIGVKRFLRKPWSVEELIQVLTTKKTPSERLDLS